MSSILQLPEVPPQPWARLGRAGEGGSFSYTLDGSGLEQYNRLMHRDLIPLTSDVSFQIRIRCKSSLVTNNPAFEGLAPRMRGFSLDGQAPATGHHQVWDSNPSAGGKAMWISGQHTEYTTFNFIISVPPANGIDYVTLELVCRADSGQVQISNVECRYYYGRLVPIEIGGAQRWESAAFGQEQFETNFSGNDVRRWLKYLRTEPINARKGQNLIFNTNSALNGIGWQFKTGVSVAQEPAPTIRGFLSKLRRKGTGDYDHVDVVSNYTQASYRPTVVNETRAVRARYDYDQWDLVAFVETQPDIGYDTFGPQFIEYKDVVCDLLVADFVAPSQ